MPNVSSAIGQTLFAVKDVNIKRQASDSSPTVYVAKKGESIGTVKGYLEPNSSRSRGYFVFNDKNGKAYYTVHDNSLYDKKFDSNLTPGNGRKEESKVFTKAQNNKKYITFLVVSVAISLLFWYLRKRFKINI